MEQQIRKIHFFLNDKHSENIFNKINQVIINQYETNDWSLTPKMQSQYKLLNSDKNNI